MKKILFIIMMAVMALAANAEQEDKKFDPKQFRREQEAFITKEAGLSAQEAAAFFPLFRELQEKQRALFSQQMKIARKKPENDKEALRLINEMDELELSIVKLKMQYHGKFCKAIPARKVKQCIRAEEKYKRNIMDRLAKGPRAGKPARPQQPKK